MPAFPWSHPGIASAPLPYLTRKETLSLKIEKLGEIVYIERAVPEWRNWQTRWTQNPVPGDRGEGSIPSSGILIPLNYQGVMKSWMARPSLFVFQS